MSTRRFHLMAAIPTTLLMLCGANAAMAAPMFLQDFEVDATDWFDFGGTITQVASGGGTLGVTSAGGSTGHAEVALGTSSGNGAFTRFGGYSSVWPGFIRQSLDVYIDPASGSIGDGWFLDNAVNDNTGVWEEAGGVGVLKATDGFWWLTADADGGAYQGPAGGGVGLKFTAADWYTIDSEWTENPDGLTVDRDTFVYNSSGTLLYQNFNPQQVSLAAIGGHRYGWIASSGQGGPLTLAIDNSSLLAVPEPSTFVLFATGVACVLGYGRRRKRKMIA